MNIFIVPFAAGVLALGVVVYSFFSEVDFYPGKHPKPDAKPLPRWYGRLFFGCDRLAAHLHELVQDATLSKSRVKE